MSWYFFICFGGMFITHNGIIKAADEPILTAQNRSFKYGDGLFETLKVHQGSVMLASLHFERLFSGLLLLGIAATDDVTASLLEEQIKELCTLNRCAALARVRLTVYREEDDKAGYVIEAVPLHPEENKWNEEGWTADIYPYARKSCDVFARLKSTNHLPYVAAQLYAQEKGIDECLLLNNHNRICDGSRTNIFLVNKEKFYTPALYEGCVDGVMRRYLMDALKQRGFVVVQTEVNEALLQQSEECFLTNAIRGIRWIRSFREKQYSCTNTKTIYKEIIAPLYLKTED
ncbi:MAG: aminotransferase class IV [Flavisolibacter sp.]|nr:aminotransferase class IV [Flavisolibacter sp.]